MTTQRHLKSVAIVVALLVLATNVQAYSSGNRVQCNGTNVSVRSSPSTSGGSVGSVSSPDKGSVVSGPYSGTGSTGWYYINWDKGISGYTAQEYLQLAPAPTATTNPATNITSSGATFNGTFNPNGTTTNAYFEWGNTTSYGNFTSSVTVNATSPQALQSTLINAPPNTTFHYRIAAGSDAGAAYGNDASFTTSPTPTPNYTLNIASSNPSSGVSVSSYVGNTNFASGTTPTSRSFSSGTTVGVTCPSTLTSGNTFQKWQLDGSDYDTNTVTSVVMNSGHTLTAVYASAPPNYTLNIASSNPSSGVAVSSYVGNTNFASGTTPTSRSFSSGTTVGVTCPSTLTSGNTFQKWQLDGSDYDTNTVTSVVMNSGHTLTTVYASQPSPTPSPSITPTPSPSPTSSPTATATATPTVTPSTVQVFLSLHSLRADAISNVSNAGVDDPLLPIPDESVLGASQPSADRGLVADDVTPLLIEIDSLPSPADATNFQITTIVTGGHLNTATLDQRIYALHHPASGAANFSLGGNFIISPSHPSAFAYIAAIKCEDVQFDFGSSELSVTLKIIQAGFSEAARVITFAIRKPPVVLVHGYKSDNGAWYQPGSLTTPNDFLATLQQSIPADFILPIEYGVTRTAKGADDSVNTTADFEYLAALLDMQLRDNVESTRNAWRFGWALTRYDAVGHSQGGILLRMLCTDEDPKSSVDLDFHRFRSEDNANRGRFHRIITMGSPHNGSTNVHYLFALGAGGGVEGLLSLGLFVADILQPKFDPFSSQLTEINVTHWHVDTGAKFHVIGTTIYGGNEPPLITRDSQPLPKQPPRSYIIPGLCDVAPGQSYSRGHIVLPAGSDGVVDLASELAGSLTDRITATVVRGTDISHSPPTSIFGVNNGATDTQSSVTGARVAELLKGPATNFGPFVLTPVLPNVADQIAAVVPGLVHRKAIQMKSASILDRKTLRQPSSIDNLVTTYELLLTENPADPTTGDPAWHVEVFGPSGITDAGVIVQVDPADSKHVTVSVDNSLVGDVVMYASYQAASGNLVAADPFLLVSQPPPANKTGIEVVPKEITLPAGSSLRPELWADYGDGSRSRLYISEGAEIQFQASEASIAAVDSTGTISFNSPGTSTITVSYSGLQAQTVVTVLPQVSPPHLSTQLANISTRLSVGTGDNAMIGGFIITGTQPKTVIVRGIGPSLAGFGIQGALSDPVIEVYDSGGVLRGTNDNWNDAQTRQQIIDSGLAPTNELESALWGTINPGAYTVVVRGKNNGTGVGLFEVYDLDQTVDSKLANISTRGFVDTGDNVMIGGTIVTGTASANVLIRAIGPSLTNFGVPNGLQDPTLELHNAQGGTIASNDNWVDSPDAEAISATTLQPSDNRESAILQNLAPGAYTAIVRGSGNSTGVALVEAYQLQ